MDVSKRLLKCQIAAYVTGVLLSIFIIASMSNNLYKFDFRCLLFAHVPASTWPNVLWGSSAYCGYVIFVGILLLFVCSMQAYRSYKLLRMETASSFRSAFLEAVGCMLLTALVMYAAVVVTLGFMAWCDEMLKRYPTCQDAGGQDIDNNINIVTDDFYSEINILQISTWAAFSTCVGLTVCAMVKVCYLHRLANIPMALRGERQPLLTESSGNAAPITTRQ